MPPAGDLLLNPRAGDDPRDDPRDRAWRCSRPLGRLREEDVGCSSGGSVSSEGFLGPVDQNNESLKHRCLLHCRCGSNYTYPSTAACFAVNAWVCNFLQHD